MPARVVVVVRALECRVPTFDAILVQALSRTGHNSIIQWIHSNSPELKRIINWEDKPLKDDPNMQTVVIFRDVYNWFASWLTAIRKWKSDTDVINSTPSLIQIWKGHAQEFLGDTKIIPNAKFIVFDLWCTQREYRDRVAEDLALTKDDNMVLRMSNAGGGSTWDGMKFDGKANKMKVRERWRTMTDDEKYMEFMNDPELRELTQRVFGYDSPLPRS